MLKASGAECKKNVSRNCKRYSTEISEPEVSFFSCGHHYTAKRVCLSARESELITQAIDAGAIDHTRFRCWQCSECAAEVLSIFWEARN